MHVKLETIYPDRAKKILETKNNINVRKISNNVIAHYARQMITGKWHFTWDCIAFDKDGNLLNGQHRLMACVRSNIPLKAFVVYDAVDITGDTGKRRTVVEELRGLGEKLPDGFESSFATGCLRDVCETYFSLSKATADELLQITSYAGIKKSLKVIRTMAKAPRGVKNAPVTSGIIGGYIATRDERCLEFADILASGNITSAEQAIILKTREKLAFLGDDGSRHRNIANEKRIIVQSGLKNYLEGRNPSRLKVKDAMIWKPNEFDFRDAWEVEERTAV